MLDTDRIIQLLQSGNANEISADDIDEMVEYIHTLESSLRDLRKQLEVSTERIVTTRDRFTI